MLAVPRKRELPVSEAGDDPPKLKSVVPLAETLMGHLLASHIPDTYSELAIGTLAEMFSRLVGIPLSMHLIVREGIRMFFANKQISNGNVFRALMYVIANASELRAGNVVPSLHTGIPPKTTLWQLIKVINITQAGVVDTKGMIYNVEFIILTAPLAGSTFSCKISSKQVKRLIRDNSSCKYSPHVIPEFLFGYKLMALIKNTGKGIGIQQTFPQSSIVSYNVKIKKARLDCKRNMPCTACYKGLDKCRFAVKQKSWPLVVCPYCLNEAYEYAPNKTTCTCYKEDYRERE